MFLFRSNAGFVQAFKYKINNHPKHRKISDKCNCRFYKINDTAEAINPTVGFVKAVAK